MKLIKEIKSKSGEIHFRRWKLITIPWVCSIYIHGIYKADEDLHLHNHPWKIWTMILWGGYIEQIHNNESPNLMRIRTFGHIAYTNRSGFHKIEKMIKSPTYTLAVVGRRAANDDWGYMVDGRFIDHKTYRNKKRGI